MSEVGTSPSGKMVRTLFSKKSDVLVKRFWEFRENSQWIALQREGLRHHYPNKYIAVRDRKVVEADENLTNLLNRIKQKYGGAQEVAIDYITKERVKLLL